MLAVEKELCERSTCHTHLLSQLSRSDLYPPANGWMAHISGGTLDKVSLIPDIIVRAKFTEDGVI